MKNTSYCIRIMWQPLRLVGGSGGTNSCSDFQSSVSPALIFPRDTAASSFDGDLTLVVYGGPDVDGFSRYVSPPVQPDPAGHGPGRHAGHAKLVLDFTMERLSQNSWLLIEVDGVHDDEDLLVFVRQT